MRSMVLNASAWRSAQRSNFAIGSWLLAKSQQRRAHFLMKPVPTGARAECSEVVEHHHTLSHHHDQLPPVYSTPDMIRLMETACFHALMPYHEEGEINV